MSSRGFFFGQIVDDLDGIASQVRQRCLLGQFDLNRILEDFFKEILNLVYGWNLQNLNDERSNEPGIDLGDKASRVAVQVTSRTDAAKIHATLDNAAANFASDYDTVFLLMIGERKKSYTINAAKAAKFKFEVEKHVIDITTLCRAVLSLDLPSLQSVHRKIADEQARIKIELEPRLPSGTFQTKIEDFIESAPEVIRSDASLFVKHQDVQGLFEQADAQMMLSRFIKELRLLPRISREFYGWLIDNSNHHLRKNDDYRINIDIVESRAARVPSLEAELRILRTYGFIDYDEPEEHGQSAHWRLLFPGPNPLKHFGEGFMNFTRAERLSCSTLFQTMNFSVFGPEPTKTGPAATPKAAKTNPVSNRVQRKNGRSRNGR